MTRITPEEQAATAGHTPGPWRVEGAGRHAIVRGADETIVAVRHRLPFDIHEANARLIAAAPTMAAALASILERASKDGLADAEKLSNIRSIARAALTLTGASDHD